MRLAICLVLTLWVGTAWGQQESSTLRIDSLRVVFSRAGERVHGELSFQLDFGPNGSSRPAQVRLPLPAGMVGVTIADEEVTGVRIEDATLAIDAPRPSGKKMVAIRGYLPIRDGEVRYRQRLGIAVSQAEAFSTWTAGEVELFGLTGQPAFRSELSDGRLALVLLGSGLKDGDLNITLRGLTNDRRAAMSWAAFALSLFFVGLGLYGRLARTKRRGSGDGARG